MLFNSFTFAGFFALAYVLYLLSMRRLVLQNALLLAVSYVFYAWWDWRFLGLIILSTLVDFICGRQLDKRREHDRDGQTGRKTLRARRVILLISLGANLGILGAFKYFDFFAASAAELLSAIGLPLEPRLLNLVLPVGISFYTFQTLSYTIDIYRGTLRAHHSLLDFAVFVAFFPQLVAGPIVRARVLLPQVAALRRLHLDRIYEGAYLILWGLFKKVVIADNLAVLVDAIYGAEATPIGGTVVIAVYAFTIQIYCDFSGYSDIARGCAMMMGFDIPLNFNLPYFAANPREFWQRWHMSLSSWLRDYIYIPLGGSRGGLRRMCIAIMLTMVLGGLWHGAAWTFVLWGAYHGAVLLVHRAMMPWLDGVTGRWTGRSRLVARWLAVVGFFHLVCLGLLIFRADSVGQVGAMLASIATPWPWWVLSGAVSLKSIGAFTLLAYTLPLFIVQVAQQVTGDLNVVLRMPAPARGLAYTAMFYALVVFGYHYERPFIYFQF